MVENYFLKLFIDLLLFTEDDIAFPLNGRILELAILKNVGKDVDGVWDIGVEGLGIINGVFTL